jgi:xanthine dehydrogenase accessory factor
MAAGARQLDQRDLTRIVRFVLEKEEWQMQRNIHLSDIRVGVRGAGDLASGVAWRLYHCGFKVFMTEIDQPMAVRRKVAFCEAIYDGSTVVEGVEARLARTAEEIFQLWGQKKIPILVDPQFEIRKAIDPAVLVDAILAKKNKGTSIEDAGLVIALGPGFTAGKDAHFVVETNRGHYLGRLLISGSAEPNTGVPGPVQGISAERVLRAPAAGTWESKAEIGDLVKKGDLVGSVEGVAVNARIDGVIRGLIRSGIRVSKDLKIGDIDPRGNKDACGTISEKALAIGGGVLEGILRFYSQ